MDEIGNAGPARTRPGRSEKREWQYDRMNGSKT